MSSWEVKTSLNQSVNDSLDDILSVLQPDDTSVFCSSEWHVDDICITSGSQETAWTYCCLKFITAKSIRRKLLFPKSLPGTYTVELVEVLVLFVISQGLSQRWRWTITDVFFWIQNKYKIYRNNNSRIAIKIVIEFVQQKISHIEFMPLNLCKIVMGIKERP